MFYWYFVYWHNKPMIHTSESVSDAMRIEDLSSVAEEWWWRGGQEVRACAVVMTTCKQTGDATLGRAGTHTAWIRANRSMTRRTHRALLCTSPGSQPMPANARDAIPLCRLPAHSYSSGSLYGDDAQCRRRLGKLASDGWRRFQLISVYSAPPYIIDTGKSVSSVDVNSPSWELAIIWRASGLLLRTMWNHTHTGPIWLYGASLWDHWTTVHACFWT